MARKNDMTKLNDVLEVMEPSPNALCGKSFSVSGHLGKPRKEIIDLIEKAGGRFDKAPRWGTTYLVTNFDWNAGSTIADDTSRKIETAKRNGVKIISEATLYEMLTAEE